MITQVCWLVGWIICLFGVLLVKVISQSCKSNFSEIRYTVQHLCQMSLLAFERSRSKYKVKTAVEVSQL